MLFTSYVFLFFFLPLGLILYHLPSRKYRHIVLLFLSVVFYGVWRADFVLLVIFSTLVDFFCGRMIYENRLLPGRKNLFLLLSITTNLGLLCYFKYFNFGIDTINFIMTNMGFQSIELFDVILPVGISFFTFQTMSYSIDVYRGEITPSTDILKFGTYVSMFPQLVAGPIVRYREISETLNSPKKYVSHYRSGIYYFMLGFNKKVLVANNISDLADFAFDFGGGDFLTSFIGALAYTLQIYFDFSGYSDMAIGLGLMFGFRFPMNFNSPYKSASISEFWNRWHITLSNWFRDYLYIPLGGNRLGVGRTYFNLFIVMFLCGLWHGAEWTFVIWGCFHGLILMLERINGRRALGYHRLPNFLKVLITFIIIVVGWIPFRAENVTNMIQYFKGLMTFKKYDQSAIYEVWDQERLFILLAGLFIVFAIKNSHELELKNNWFLQLFNSVLFILATHELMNQSYNPFLYFNF